MRIHVIRRNCRDIAILNYAGLIPAQKLTNRKGIKMALFEGVMSAPDTHRRAMLVPWLCLAVTTLDGLDLTMYGTVVPSLVKLHQWGLGAGTLGLIGSLSLAGMAVGATVSGSLADMVGRRPIIIGCVACFAVFTGLCAVAPNAETFGLLRFLAGIGFGGAMPSTIALTQDYVRPGRKQFYNGFIQVGFCIGGIVGAAAAIAMIPAFGWQSIFALGGILALLLLPVVFFLLPESVSHPARKTGGTRQNGVSAPPRRSESIRRVFQPGFRLASMMFPVIAFFGLLISYGMTTWLPQILVSKGYGFASGMSFLIAYFVGGGIGMLVVSALAERFGSRTVISVAFLACTLSIFCLVLQPPTAVIVLLVFLVGFFITATTVVYGFVGIYYPADARGSAVGLSVGLGRLGGVCGPIVTGAVVGAGVSKSSAFYLFAFAAVLASIAVAAIPRTGVSDRQVRRLSTADPAASAAAAAIQAQSTSVGRRRSSPWK